MVKLGTCLQRRKDTVMPATLSDNSVGLVGLEDIQDGGRGGITIRQTPPQEIESLKTRFVAGDILYGKLRPYLNKVGITPQSGICSTEIWAFGPSSLVDSKYAAFFLASSFFVDRVSSLIKGANLPRVDAEAFDSIEIPLPPLSEQQQIVAILQEAEEIRRLRAVAEFKTADLIPWMFQSVFGDPLGNPKKWPVAALGGLINGTPKNGLYKPAELYGEGTPIIRIGDFTGGILRNAKSLQRLRISDEEITQFGVSNNQILINRVNSMEHLGKSLLVASLTEPTVYESNMMRLDPNLDRILPDYLIACLHHPSTLSKLRAKAKKAINQASINQTDVVTLEIPVPPLEAQKTFATQVREVELILSLEEEALRTGKLLEESLSAHAFSGHLTADWREANKEKLAIEALERDAALAEAGSAPRISRRATIQELDRIFADRTDGIYSDLNREQRILLREIDRMFAGVDYGRYFTAEKIADEIEGPLHRNPQGVLAHLQVFAARGLLIPVSRRRKDATGSPFAGCYRLPLKATETVMFPGGEHTERLGHLGDDVRGELMKIQRRLTTGAI